MFQPVSSFKLCQRPRKYSWLGLLTTCFVVVVVRECLKQASLAIFSHWASNLRECKRWVQALVTFPWYYIASWTFFVNFQSNFQRHIIDYSITLHRFNLSTLIPSHRKNIKLKQNLALFAKHGRSNTHYASHTVKDAVINLFIRY